MWFLISMLLTGCSKHPEALKTEAPVEELNVLEIQAQVPKVKHAMGISVKDAASHLLVEVTLDGIFLNGERVMALKAGVISAADQKGYLITSLYEQTEQTSDARKQAEVTQQKMGEELNEIMALIAMDARAPTETLQAVMYSLGQAQVGNFLFLVEDENTPPWSGLPEGSWAGRSVLATPKDQEVTLSFNRHFTRSSDETPSVTTSLAEVDTALKEMLKEETVGCAIQVLNFGDTYGNTMALMDVLYGNGAKDIVVAGGGALDENSQPLPEIEELPARILRYTTNDTLAVFGSNLPSIGPPSSVKPDNYNESHECGGTDFEEEPEEVEVEDPVGLGSVNIDAVKDEVEGVTSVVKRYKGRIKLCYDQALREDPLLQGRIEIEFSVGPVVFGKKTVGGRVSKAAVSTNDTGNQPLAECILRKVKGLTFDPSVEADVIYPFVLSQ